jgi:hypothetical protein
VTFARVLVLIALSLEFENILRRFPTPWSIISVDLYINMKYIFTKCLVKMYILNKFNATPKRASKVTSKLLFEYAGDQWEINWRLWEMRLCTFSFFFMFYYYYSILQVYHYQRIISNPFSFWFSWSWYICT